MTSGPRVTADELGADPEPIPDVALAAMSALFPPTPAQCS